VKRVAIVVDGLVQGVGFRWWTRNLAQSLGLTGTVENLWDGRVECHAQGPDDAVDRLVDALTSPRPPMRRPGRVSWSHVSSEPVVVGEAGFDAS